MKIKFKKYEFGNLVVGIPTEIGPRILYLSLKEKDNNIFGILPDFSINTDEGKWHIWGGHRLWVSPEDKPKSYSLDNKPVEIKEKRNSVIIYGNSEIKNSVQKIIEIKKKGKKVDKNGLLPDRHITLWPYTDITDKRLIFKKDFIFLKQDERIKKPVKIGAFISDFWTAYYVDGLFFLKEIEKVEGEYPDYGCNVEAYTNSEFLELETLSPLKEVKPGDFLVHREIWSMKKAIKNFSIMLTE